MELFLPPVEVVLPCVFDASVLLPKCDCKVQALLDSVHFKAEVDSVPIRDVEFGVFIPGGRPRRVQLPGWQVWLPPNRIQSGKSLSKLSSEEEPGESSVRSKISDGFTEGFSLGDCAEAVIPARNELHVSSDWDAEIIIQGEIVDVIDDDIYHLRHSHTGNIHVVARDKLRPVHTALQSLADWCCSDNGSFITMAKVAVLNELSEWASSPSLHGDFLCNILWEKSGVLLATIQDSGKGENGTLYTITVYGSTQSVEHARSVISHHMKTVLDAVTFQERRSRRLKLLEDRRGGQDTSERVEFFVHESLVGLVIGKQGENLARVARNHKVEVRVFPDENGVRRLRIYGSDPTKVERAKAELDYHFLELPLPKAHAESFVEWVTADKSFLRDCCNRHALHSLWYHPVRQSLVICGLRRSIDDFIRALDLSYRDTHQSAISSPLLKTSSYLRTSPSTAAAIHSSGGRNQSTSSRSHSLVESPPSGLSSNPGGPRPPILDALHKGHHHSSVGSRLGSGSRLGGAPPPPPSAPSSATGILREFKHTSSPDASALYGGSSKRGSTKASPLLRSHKSGIEPRPPSWWQNNQSNSSSSSVSGAPEKRVFYRNEAAGSWHNNSYHIQRSSNIAPHSMQQQIGHMHSTGEYCYCRPDVPQQLATPPTATPQLYCPYDMSASSQSIDFNRKLPSCVRAAPPYPSNMQASMMTSGYYWV